MPAFTHIKLWGTFLLLLQIQFVCSQAFHFSPLSQESGLDRQAILSIAQDRQGRLWFGGQSNIFVYDSQHITNLVSVDTAFKHIGYITKIGVNAQNHLLIASSTSFRIYDIDRRQTVTASLAPGLTVLDIGIIDEQTFLCTTDGLYRLDFHHGNYELQALIAEKDVQTISSLGKNRYAIAGQAGVETFTLTGNAVSGLTNIRIPVSSVAPRVFPSMFSERDTLWVASKFGGLFRYDLTTKRWVNFNEDNSNILSNNIREVIRDGAGNLLVGTLKGLSVIHPPSAPHRFINHRHNGRTRNSLSQNSIYDLFIDRQHIVWVGTYYGGINAIYPNTTKLTVYSTTSNPTQRLNSDIVSSFAESEYGYWIGTEEEGINFLDKNGLKTTAFSNFTSSDLIKDLYIRGGKLYAAQYAGGYSVIDIVQRKSTHFRLHPDLFHPRNNIYSIYIDSQKNTWLGTNVGLYKVDEQGPRYIPQTGENVITDIQADQKGTIYVMAQAKLYKKSMEDPRFHIISGMEQLEIDGFYIDKENNVWVTHAEAIHRLSPQGSLQQVARFRGNHLGWPIYINNKLWITSKDGLVFFDNETGYTNVLTRHDGLPVGNLQNAKLYISGDKALFVATLNGLVSINLDQVRFNTVAPTVILHDIWIDDEMAVPFQRLTREGDSSYGLVLQHDENFITVGFSSSNFIKPLKNRYRYKLEGFDKGWIESNTPHIRYTNIPEGDHSLLIYASNNDMVWAETPLQIHIKVLPPLWQTWWAYTLYALLFAAIAYLVVKFIVEREILINAEKEHGKKIKFFTAISHEIRTPLTLITTPLDEIITETANEPKTQLKLKRVKKNAAKLLHIVNELLDFRRFDSKHQRLKKSDIALREYIEDNFYLLHDLAQAKEINYYIRRIDKVGLFPLDPFQFDKVLFNLLSNAIKYTPQGGTVYLDLVDGDDAIEISIADNGAPIAESNRFKIFEEYYRENETENVIGTGIGLALTKQIVEQHEGSISCETIMEDGGNWVVFTVTLKKDTTFSSSVKEDEEPEMLATEATAVVPFRRIDDENRDSILVADDNKELLQLVVSIFEENYTVFTAGNGEEALRMAGTHLPDLIIADVMMPKMNGIELCGSIKSNVTTSHIPFILLTAITDPSVYGESLQCGANIYIAKPFDRHELYLSTYNLLTVSKANRKDFRRNLVRQANGVDREFIWSLDRLIDDNLTRDGFDVAFIAREMGMSAPILYKKLRALTDLSLNNYVKIHRLTRAKELLLSTSNISEVAYTVGFSDRKYFSKEFKKLFGINPSEFMDSKEME
ncbi:response regulator [Parapedobacter sp.]